MAEPKVAQTAEMRAREVLLHYYAEHGVMPSQKLLAELLGTKSTGTVNYAVQKLRKAGYLGSTEYGRLTPGPIFPRHGIQVGLGSGSASSSSEGTVAALEGADTAGPVQRQVQVSAGSTRTATPASRLPETSGLSLPLAILSLSPDGLESRGTRGGSSQVVLRVESDWRLDDPTVQVGDLLLVDRAGQGAGRREESLYVGTKESGIWSVFRDLPLDGMLVGRVLGFYREL